MDRHRTANRAGIFSGWFLVTDMDGTLLRSDDRISEANLAALHRFAEAGGTFTVATGRMKGKVDPYIAQLPVTAPAILYNGSLVWDYEAGCLLWGETLPQGVGSLLEPIREAFPHIGIEVYTDDGGVYVAADHPMTARHQRHGVAARYGLGYQSMGWRKVSFLGDPAVLDTVERKLRRDGLTLPMTRAEPDFLDILPGDVNKGVALNRLTNQLGLDAARVVAVGNGQNDLEMLQQAAWGVAVANSHPSLFRAASRRGLHHDNDALADVVDWLEYTVLPWQELRQTAVR